MTSTTLDQINGFSGSLALKQPVRLATLVDIVLEGLIAIDGIVPAEGDRVLVKAQATPSQNGIYIASTGVWSRAVDFDATGKVVKGTQVWVTDGTTQAGTLWIVSAANPVIVDTSALTWQAGNAYQQGAAMATAIIAATSKPTPVAADRIGYVNSVDNSLVQMTWAQMMAALLPGAAASSFVRRNAGNTAYEHRTPAQVLSDIAALPLAGGTLTGQLNGTGVGGSHLSAPDTSFGLTLAGSFGGGLLFKDGAGRAGAFTTGSGAELNLFTAGTSGGIAAVAQLIADGLVLTGTAKGIKFPATANPSTDANTLDDYEEGTWTPTMTFGGSSTGVTYGTRDGRYVKIGSMVWLGIRVTLTNNGSGTGQCVITSLPFTSLNAGNAALGCFMAEYWAGTTGVVGNLLAIIGSNSTSAGMRMSGGTNTVDVSDTVIGNSATVYLDGWYRAAA